MQLREERADPGSYADGLIGCERALEKRTPRRGTERGPGRATGRGGYGSVPRAFVSPFGRNETSGLFRRGGGGAGAADRRRRSHLRADVWRRYRPSYLFILRFVKTADPHAN